MKKETPNPRVIVIGAGPAGIRCCEALIEHGLRPSLIDESNRVGGQIYRQQPKNFKRSYSDLYGTESKKALAVHQAFSVLQDKIDYLPECSVWNIDRGQLHLATSGRLEVMPFDSLVICSGATDRLMPVKGWNLSGTYSMGGAQVALKSQACAIGKKVVFMGTGPLLYLIASQYAKNGAGVAAVLDTSGFFRRVLALPRLLAKPSLLWKGVLLTATLYRHGVKLRHGIRPLEIQGSAQLGVQKLLYLDGWDQEQNIDCDAVAIGYHLRPETQLADLAGCEFHFNDDTRQWMPDLDEDGRSSARDIYLAGDGAHILGADAAELSGELAGRAVLADRGIKTADARVTNLRRRLRNAHRFASGLSLAFPWPIEHAGKLPDDAVVCRCETITAGELRSVVKATGSNETNRAKAFSRVGMGRCQGRYCANAAAEIIADCSGTEISAVGRQRGQAPIKPLSIKLAEKAQ
jgi:NADPH-dependent 2,4-dienoyl-CoA reductase/sulfur reductase-like enzyme